MATAVSDGTGQFEGCVQEEIGLIAECNILSVGAFTLEDSELDNGRWIDRSSVRGCCEVLV